MDGVLSGKRIVQISAGGEHTMMLADDSMVYGGGNNQFGQLGDGTLSPRLEPVPMKMDGVLNGKKIIEISAGHDFTLLLDDNGKVYSVGTNKFGQLCDGTTEMRLEPIALNMGAFEGIKMKQLYAGNEHTMMLDFDGKVYGCGQNYCGQLGFGSFTLSEESLVPMSIDLILSGSPVVQISVSRNKHILMIHDNGKVYGVGGNEDGQLGDGTIIDRIEPVPMKMDGVLQGKKIIQLSAGLFHSIMIDSSFEVFGVGENSFGQLGDGTKETRLEPVAMNTEGVMKGKQMIQVSAGKFHTVALGSDGRIYCSGNLKSGHMWQCSFGYLVGSCCNEDGWSSSGKRNC